MVARTTIERVLWDDDDCSGQTVRRWCIECADGTATIRKERDVGFVISLPIADVDIFVDDLRRAIALAAPDTPTPPAAGEGSGL
jgi:hypothetical protein